MPEIKLAIYHRTDQEEPPSGNVLEGEYRSTISRILASPLVHVSLNLSEDAARDLHRIYEDDGKLHWIFYMEDGKEYQTKNPVNANEWVEPVNLIGNDVSAFNMPVYNLSPEFPED